MEQLREIDACGTATAFARLVSGFSIEVLPRTADKISDFREILPEGTRIYIANIEGTDFNDMLRTAKRISQQGFTAVPHITATSIKTRNKLAEYAERYRHEACTTEALLIAGGTIRPEAPFRSTMQMLETGIFGRTGFTKIFVAGHPEGNCDIAPDGDHRKLDTTLLEKQEYAVAEGMAIELTTQFAFDASAVSGWIRRIRDIGVLLPVNVGIAGPAKLQTLLKFALACGVGPSIKVLQRRARDVTRLLRPYSPDEVVGGLAENGRCGAAELIAGLHIFPLGGIQPAAAWAAERSADTE